MTLPVIGLLMVFAVVGLAALRLLLWLAKITEGDDEAG